MTKRLSTKYAFPLLCMGILAAFCAVATLWNQLPVTDWLKMLFYQIFCMLLPGYAVLSLLRLPRKNAIYTLGFSYAIGYCISILTYLCMIPLSFLTDAWMIGIPVLNYAVAAFGILYAVYAVLKGHVGKDETERTSIKDIRFLLLFWFALFLLYFLLAGLPNRLPGNGSEQAYYSDTLYWIGNAISLSKGFPPESVRGSGYIISYHYFSSMQLVSMEKTVWISLSTLGFAYSYVQSTLLLATGFYCLMDSFVRSNAKKALSLLLLMFSMGIYGQTGILYTSHMVTAPFGFEYAMGLFAFAVMLLCSLHRKEIPLLRGGALYLLLLVICVGTKAPVGVMLLGLEGLLCLRWLIRKEKWTRVVLFGGISVILFAAVYLLFMTDGLSWVTSSTASTSSAASSGTGFPLLSWEGTSQYAPILRLWYRLSLPAMIKPLLGVLLFLLFVFFINMAIMLLAGWNLCRMIRYRKQSEDLQWIFLILVAVGIGMTLYIPMTGYSQVYFTDAILPFATLLAFYEPASMPPAKSPTWDKVKWSIALPLALLCCIMSVRTSYPMVRDGVMTVCTGKLSLSKDNSFMDSNLVTPLEAEGYAWIRHNTSSDALLITNATVNLDNPLMTNVFAERRIYMESNATPSVTREEANQRMAYISAFMRGSSRAYRHLLDEGVNYAVLLTRFKTGYEYTEQLDCVYRNAELEVYRLQ